ncbi:MAG: hypothetical protein WDN72_00025 [Alphaproteobacteria bacterium]
MSDTAATPTPQDLGLAYAQAENDVWKDKLCQKSQVTTTPLGKALDKLVKATDMLTFGNWDAADQPKDQWVHALDWDKLPKKGADGKYSDASIDAYIHSQPNTFREFDLGHNPKLHAELRDYLRASLNARETKEHFAAVAGDKAAESVESAIDGACNAGNLNPDKAKIVADALTPAAPAPDVARPGASPADGGKVNIKFAGDFPEGFNPSVLQLIGGHRFIANRGVDSYQFTVSPSKQFQGLVSAIEQDPRIDGHENAVRAAAMLVAAKNGLPNVDATVASGQALAMPSDKDVLSGLAALDVAGKMNLSRVATEHADLTTVLPPATVQRAAAAATPQNVRS